MVCGGECEKVYNISRSTSAGKSTVSQMVAKTLGYQHISMDSIIAGIEKVFPETDIDTEASVEPQRNLKYISSKIAPFIRAMMDSGEYDECDYGVIFDVYQLLPEDYVTYIDDEKCDIAYFLSSDSTQEERYRILQLYDTPDDYTYFYSQEEKQRVCADIVNISNYLKQQCILYGLSYYETSYNREKVLGEFISKLSK